MYKPKSTSPNEYELGAVISFLFGLFSFVCLVHNLCYQVNDKITQVLVLGAFSALCMFLSKWLWDKKHNGDVSILPVKNKK